MSKSEGLVAIPEKYEKHAKLLRKAKANEYSLNKEQTSYTGCPKAKFERFQYKLGLS